MRDRKTIQRGIDRWIERECESEHNTQRGGDRKRKRDQSCAVRSSTGGNQTQNNWVIKIPVL